MKRQSLSTNKKFDTQKSFTKMGCAMNTLLTFIEKNPTRLFFHEDECSGHKKKHKKAA